MMLQSTNVIHCDLKPENILLIQRNKTGLKLIDFGSSCFDNKAYYTYIQSRYYRAPEILLGLKYGNAIDMWSFGCIMAELYNGYPIFSGESEYDQLAYIMEYLGIPSFELISQSKRRGMFFDDNYNPLYYPTSRGKIRKPKSKTFEGFLKKSDSLFVDFIQRCLAWLPDKRLTPDQALQHQWILNEIPSNLIETHQRQITLLSRSIIISYFIESNNSAVIADKSIALSSSQHIFFSKTNSEHINRSLNEKLHQVKKKLPNKTVNIHINLNKPSKPNENQ